MKSKRLLIVEDQAIVAADLEARLRTMGYEPVGVTALGENAFPLAEELQVDLVLMDIQLKGATDGITAANHIRDGLEIPVVFVTAHTDEATFQRARITAPFGYVLKPFNDHELHTAIEVALDRHASEVRLKRTQQSLATVIESIGGGLVVTDEWGLVQMMNRAASLLSGWSPEEAFLKPFGEVFGFVDTSTLEPVDFPIPKTADAGLSALGPRTLKLPGRAGGAAIIDCACSPIRHGNGRVTGMVWMLSDRTREDALQKQAGAA